MDEWESRDTFFLENCQNSNVCKKEIFLVNSPSFWRFKFLLYDDLSKYVARSFPTISLNSELKNLRLNDKNSSFCYSTFKDKMVRGNHTANFKNKISFFKIMVPSVAEKMRLMSFHTPLNFYINTSSFSHPCCKIHLRDKLSTVEADADLRFYDNFSLTLAQHLSIICFSCSFLLWTGHALFAAIPRWSFVTNHYVFLTSSLCIRRYWSSFTARVGCFHSRNGNEFLDDLARSSPGKFDSR